MTTTKKKVIGVLALQGAFIEHIEYFNKAIQLNSDNYLSYTFTIIPIKTKEELQQCDALVIPGGESSSMSYIAERTNLLPHLYAFVADENKTVWGTCAGLIFLSKQIQNGLENQKCLGGLNIETNRNAFGSQLDSFVTNLDFSKFIPNCNNFPAVFIRAPVVTKIFAENDSSVLTKIPKSENNTSTNTEKVQVLYQLELDKNDLIVAVRQGRILGTSFHPELADDYRFHQWFIDEFVIKK